MRIWINAQVYTSVPGAEAIANAAVAVRNGRLIYVGPEKGLPYDISEGAEIVDCDGRWITPGLIDCHTHLVFGGDRAMEFEMRLAGATYEEVARAGGGIVSSVKETNSLDVDGLVAASLPRLDTLLAEGVTTIEIKSGYGLSVEGELNMLRAARKLETLRPVRVVTTYLAAHATPTEYKGRYAAYLDDVVIPGMPPVQMLRDMGVPIAIATDCNPGTSPLTSLLLTMNMAATIFRLTVDECLTGASREAARALGLLEETGTLEVGKSADFALWNIKRPAELVYRIGFNPLHSHLSKVKRFPYDDHSSPWQRAAQGAC